MAKYTITRKGFMAWLEAKSGDEVVGQCANRGHCPIAKYMQEQTGRDVEVDAGDITIWLNDSDPWDPFTTIPTPLWASNFIHNVDERKWNSPLTADEALTILAQRD